MTTGRASPVKGMERTFILQRVSVAFRREEKRTLLTSLWNGTICFCGGNDKEIRIDWE